MSTAGPACGVPPDDPHATTPEEDNLDGESITYTCLTGFTNRGASYVRECNNGNWEDPSTANTFPCQGVSTHLCSALLCFEICLYECSSS